MKKSTLIATALVAGFGSSQAHAQLLGSDTLKDVTNQVLASCPGAGGLTYTGTGSGAGENAMNASPATQSVAPMSRKVKCTISAAKPTAEGKVLGYDGIAVAASSCTGLTGSDCLAFSTGLPGYTFQAGSDNGPYSVACDALRIIYFGRDHANNTDCNSAVRHSLVDNWDAVFQGSQSTTTCTQLRHAFRRDDLSGTTDTLRASCGIPSATTFCNGTTAQDNDPIRRTVDPTKGEIAKTDSTGLPGTLPAGQFGTLGVVLPISIASVADVYSPGTPSANSCAAATAGTTRCTAGVFRFQAYPGFGKCPGNTPRTGGLCRVPQVSAGGVVSASCVNSATNLPSGAAAGTDARVYNNTPRHADGTFVTGVTSPFYRLHETRGYFGGNGCKQSDDTRQVGCLAAADGCSIGYAGREVDQIASTTVLGLSNANHACVTPSDANILALTTAPNDAYPLSRTLYFSSLVGFANVTNANEAGLAACMSNESLVEGAISAFNFIPDPRAGIQTESFGAPNCF